jgi:hypothetical protein
MPESVSNSPSPSPEQPEQPAAPAVPAAGPDTKTEFHIGEEFGTAKRNLPPARIVLLSVAAIALVLGIVALVERPKPQGAGSINFVAAVEIPSQLSVLTAVTLTLRNAPGRSLWIHTLKARLVTADGHSYEDEAASAVDLDRYFQVFPALKESSEAPLSPETKLAPGSEKRGTLVFRFPVTKDTFDKRKSLEVAIQPYDQPLPITLK